MKPKEENHIPISYWTRPKLMRKISSNAVKTTVHACACECPGRNKENQLKKENIRVQILIIYLITVLYVCGWDLAECMVRATGCQCQTRNSPRFDTSILTQIGIWGAADEAGLKNAHKKIPKIPLYLLVICIICYNAPWTRYTCSAVYFYILQYTCCNK